MYRQAYLEQCKYKLKKRKPVNLIDSEIIDDDENYEIINDDKDDDKSYANYYGRVLNF